jgi:acetyltransferase
MLAPFFSPRGVAVIGASRDPGKLSHGLLRNLKQHGYPGHIYPINQNADEILGIKCYPDVAVVPDPVDLAVIIIPAQYVPAVLEACGKRGIQAAIVVAGGFREVGDQGAQLEAQLVEIARRYHMRLLGPNCVGIIDTITPINTSFVAGMPEPGAIAFLSQSGAVCGGLIDWTRGKGVGFSRFVSLGNEADLTETDFLAYLAHDPHTRVISAYVEAITDGRRFMEVARQVTRHKPVIVLKVGATQGGARAVMSHTGALAGSERAYQAAFKQTGVLRAATIEDLFDQALAFAYQPVPAGDRFAVVTNAGGPGALAVDAGERAGLRFATLARATVARLESRFPAEARLFNPIDMLGGAEPDDYAFALDAVLADPNVDGVVVVLVPQALIDPVAVAERIGTVAAGYQKPVVACFMGDVSVAAGIQVLHRYHIPPYTFPERASRALGAMAAYRCWLETGDWKLEVRDWKYDRARQVIARARAAGRTSLSHAEACEVLDAYRIPVVRPELARTADEAVEAARRQGYPVVLKVVSPDILHKTDVGGVALNLPDAAAVRRAFDTITDRARRHVPGAELWGVTVEPMLPGGREVIVGMSRDPQFGPLVMFGLGGVYVEALGDVSFRLAPFSEGEAWAMMAETKGDRLLQGVRGQKPADRRAIVDVLLHVSQLVTDCPDIVELDINPLLVQSEGQGVIAADARVVIGRVSELRA